MGRVKLRQDKPPISMLPWRALSLVCEIFAFGAVKYSPNGYKSEDDLPNYMDALGRHFGDYCAGDTYDKESGKHQLLHVAANALILVHFAVVQGRDPRYDGSDDDG